MNSARSLIGNSLVRYLVSLAAVIGAYLAYQSILVPFIDGNQVAVKNTIRDNIGHTDPKADLLDLFPQHAWELQRCNVLETRQAKLLYQQHRQLEDGRIEIMPLTMVLKRGPNGEYPFVIQSKEGAVLKFDKPFTLTGGIGKIETGILVGEVKIYRLSNDNQNDDSVEIDTRNVEISNDHIFTLSDVAFRMGGNHGRGRNLSIQLFDSEENQGSNPAPIQKLELAQIDYMHIHRGNSPPRNPLDPLDVANQGSFDPNVTTVSDHTNPVDQQETNRGSLDSLDGNALGAIDIHCAGSFQLDMDNMVAMFKNQVKVTSQSGNQLFCDQLWIYFEKASKSAGDSASADQNADAAPKPESQTESDFSITKLVAIGAPAKLTSSTDQAEVRADHLQFNVDTNKVLLRGANDVHVKRPGESIVASELEYYLREDGTPGDLIALGPGTIMQNNQQSNAGEPARDFKCDWIGKLEFIDFKDDPAKKLIRFYERSTILVDGTNSLSGDQVDFILSQKQAQASERSTQYSPYRLSASGNVEIRSPRLDGTTNKLLVFWPISQEENVASENEPLLGQHRLDPPGNKQAGIVIGNTSAIGNRLTRYYVNRINRTTNQEPEPITQSSIAKYKFTGDEVVINMHEDSELQNATDGIQDLTALGNVNVQQVGSYPESDPLVIRGDRLKAVNLGEELYRMSVIAAENESAFAAGRGIQLAGDVINMDQKHNRMWIDGPGEMLAKDRRSSQTNPDTTHIFWEGGMVFDGRSMEFQDNVKTISRQTDNAGATTDVQTTSVLLFAQLTDSFDFKQSMNSTESLLNEPPTQRDSNTSSQEKIRIEKIVLLSKQPTNPNNSSTDVTPAAESPNSNFVSILFNHRNENGKLEAAREIAVPSATIEPESGDVNCVGPGVVQGIQLASQSGNNTITAPIGNSGSNAKPLEYVQVKFKKSLTGNMHNNELTFDGKVRCVYAPADDWNTQIDADAKTISAAGSIRMTCDKLQLVRWQQRAADAPSIEMIATGNAHAVGETFDARAEHIGFNEATKNLILEAGARQEASIKYREKANAQPNQVTAETIRYHIETGAIKVDGYKQIDVNHQGPLRNRDN